MKLPVKFEQYGDSVNEDGDFECPESSQGVNTEDPKYKTDTTLKILLPAFLLRSNIGPDAKIILLIRSPSGVVESQGQVGMGQPDPAVRRMNYWRLMTQMRDWMEINPNPVLIVDTDDLIGNAEFWFQRIAEFTGVKESWIHKVSSKAGFSFSRAKSAARLVDPSKSTKKLDVARDHAGSIYQEMRAKCYAAI